MALLDIFTKKPDKPSPLALAELERQKAQEIKEAREWVRGFPEKKMTREEYEKLPDKMQYKYVPFGTWLKCTPHLHVPEVELVGQWVKASDRFVHQTGAAMSPPDGINYYRLVLV